MKAGILIQPVLQQGRIRVIYETNPNKPCIGVSRAIQRYAVIALTIKGTDTIRPWFGTILANIPRMTTGDAASLKLIVRDELTKAINQFFSLQQSEEDTMIDEDIISSITIEDIVIDDKYNINAYLRFYPKTSDAVTIALLV